MHIFENTRRANILYPDTQEVFDKRINYLMLAETDTEALLSQIAFARKNFSIPNGYLKDWEMLCIKTKNSIRYRIKEDRRKYLKNISEVNN